MAKVQRLDPRATARLASQLSSVAQRAKAHWGYPEAWLEEWRPELTFAMEDIKSSLVWGIEVDDQPVGFTVLSGVSTAELKATRSVVELEHMWIDPDFHGRGFGKALFRELLTAATNSGADALTVVSDPYAVGFYEQMGFAAHGTLRTTVQGRARSLPILRLPLVQPPQP